MRRTGILALVPAVVIAIGCRDSEPVAPQLAQPSPLAARGCALGMSDTQARASIDAMIATVNALEASGDLPSGQATALRTHLTNVRKSIDSGNYCAAAAQLQAFRKQVQTFVTGGVLTEEEAAPLTGGAEEILQGPKDQLAYTSDVSGNWEIYLMKSDGTGLANLTNHSAEDQVVSWSPDGSRMVFASRREGPPKLFVMNADGSGLTRITNDARGDLMPHWSPDGQRIMFTRGFDDADPHLELWVVNPDGSSPLQLAINSDVSYPSWSPDGARIAYHDASEGEYDVYAINSNGTGKVRLTTNPEFDGYPLWSPDGTQIVFRSHRDGNSQMYVVKPDGTGERRLVTSTTNDAATAWSPDGSTLAFGRCTAIFTCHIRTVQHDGSGEVDLTNDASANDGLPRWSPDGTRIAFVRHTTTSAVVGDIYTMNRDGTGKKKVTSTMSSIYGLSWRPR